MSPIPDEVKTVAGLVAPLVPGVGPFVPAILQVTDLLIRIAERELGELDASDREQLEPEIQAMKSNVRDALDKFDAALALNRMLAERGENN
jgi:hypothetical protein